MGLEALMPLPEAVASWLDETDSSSDPLDLLTITSRVFVRLKERGAPDDEIKRVIRFLAPLEFFIRSPNDSPWNSYFAPQRNATDPGGEYPCIADLSVVDVEEWVNLANVLKRPIMRARFADAAWEFGKRLGSQRNDLHRFGRLAAEMYLEAIAIGATPAWAFSLFNAATRAISLGLQFKASDLVDRGFEIMMRFADSAELTHIGLWCAPFDRLIALKGLSESQRHRILDRFEQRFQDTVASRDLYRIMRTGSQFAKYFHDQREYKHAKKITLTYGEAALEIAGGLNATMAVHHIGDVLEAYRRAGLREDAERVRLILETRAKGVLAEMKRHHFELKLDIKETEESIANVINVAHPLVALYRLASWCSPQPKQIERSLDSNEFIAHRLIPTAIIGDNGLTIGTVGTYDLDKKGQIVMEVTREMNLNAPFFLIGLEKWKKKFELCGVPDTPNLFDCALIPADRISLYRDGLLAFEIEDYVKCIHVLIPQVENSLRELLKMLEIPITKINDDGDFELKNMNNVLEDTRVFETLTEELWYFLKSLYADKHGMNLRNRIAHGDAPAEAFNRVNAALIIQSIVFLTMVRDEAMSLSEEEGTAAESYPGTHTISGEDKIQSEDCAEIKGVA
jgi:lysyl-tRNA synthetase class 1